MEGWAVVFFVIVGIAVAIGIREANQRRIVHAASVAYRHALADLRNDPANPHLREEALGRGRAYSNLTRGRRGVTPFDEVALLNDLNAACAAPRAPVPSGSRLARLYELREQEAITQEEHDQRRREVLRSL